MHRVTFSLACLIGFVTSLIASPAEVVIHPSDVIDARIVYRGTVLVLFRPEKAKQLARTSRSNLRIRIQIPQRIPPWEIISFFVDSGTVTFHLRDQKSALDFRSALISHQDHS
jgi:hypothetical protein